MDLISVVVPVYNAEPYLEECVKSILAQTYSNIEVILVDDGSKDNSLQKCELFKDESKICIVHQENQGVSVARNNGLAHATGEYVAFVDADDMLTPDSLEELYKLLHNNSADFVQGRFDFLYNNGNRVPRKHLMSKGVYQTKDLLPVMLDNGRLSGFLIGSSCAALYRMDVIKKYNISFLPGLINNEDGLFNMEYFAHSEKLYISDECVYVVRRHDNSATSISHIDDTYNTQIVDYLQNQKWITEIDNISIQYKRRAVTVALWAILRNPRSMCMFDGVKYIHSRITEERFREGLKFIDVANLRSYKRVIFWLMKYRCATTLFVFVKYIIPFLNNKIKR